MKNQNLNDESLEFFENINNNNNQNNDNENEIRNLERSRATKTYFDQSGLKRNAFAATAATRRTSSTNSSSFADSSTALDKCVEEYKAKKFGAGSKSNLHQYRQRSADDDFGGEFESDSFVRQAKMALYESLLGHNHHHNHKASSLPANNKHLNGSTPRDHPASVNAGTKFKIDMFII